MGDLITQFPSSNVVRREGDVVTRSHNDGICSVRIERPSKRNALGVEQIHALERALTELSYVHSAMLVLVLGMGTDFSSGVDLDQIGDGWDPGTGTTRLIRKMIAAPFLTVSFVRGGAIGLGASLALLCDICLLDRRAYLRFPELNHGYSASVPHKVLAGRVGQHRAIELLLLGADIDAQTADSYGLGSMVSDDFDVWQKMSGWSGLDMGELQPMLNERRIGLSIPGA